MMDMVWDWRFFVMEVKVQISDLGDYRTVSFNTRISILRHISFILVILSPVNVAVAQLRV